MKKIYLVLSMLMLSVGCAKNSDPIPNVAVDFEDSLADPKLSALNSAGGVVLVPGYGVAGLILYREPDGSYVCYDRCSSYQPEKKCAVVLDSGNLTVTDPCSGSMFSLFDGTPVKAPATVALKAYYVTVSNYEIFVSN